MLATARFCSSSGGEKGILNGKCDVLFVLRTVGITAPRKTPASALVRQQTPHLKRKTDRKSVTLLISGRILFVNMEAL